MVLLESHQKKVGLTYSMRDRGERMRRTAREHSLRDLEEKTVESFSCLLPPILQHLWNTKYMYYTLVYGWPLIYWRGGLARASLEMGMDGMTLGRLHQVSFRVAGREIIQLYPQAIVH